MARELAPDWILQQALAAQNSANNEYLQIHPSRAAPGTKIEHVTVGIKLAFIFCSGTSNALLDGLVRASDKPQTTAKDVSIKEIQVLTRDEEAATEIRQRLSSIETTVRVTLLERHDVNKVMATDVTILGGTRSDMVETQAVLQQLSGQISLKDSIIIDMFSGNASEPIWMDPSSERGLNIIRATMIQDLIVMEQPDPRALQAGSHTTTITKLFELVGKVIFVPRLAFETCTAISQNGPAMIAIMIEAFASPLIAASIASRQAYEIAAHTFSSTASIVAAGEHPALLRDRIVESSSSAQEGVIMLERGLVRHSIGQAVVSSRDALRKHGCED